MGRGVLSLLCCCSPLEPKAHIPLETAFALDCQREETRNNMKCTWPTRSQCAIAQRNHIPLAHIGAHVGHYRLALRARVGFAKVFGYRHVGIGNANVSHWGYCPTQGVLHCSEI